NAPKYAHIKEDSMLEIFQFITSGFWVFVGCTLFFCSGVRSIGWALNAMLLGWRGIRSDDVF
ncbi:hypothetical protein, partial [Vibrio crassostreae]|uniref:hypothetical protein n=1 Tax=Vibrio crassostreae TaxID=246167 RepID=UPI00354BF6FD